MATRLTLDRAARPCISQALLTATSSRWLLIDCSLFTFQIRSLETELSASPEEETHQRQTSPLGKSYLHSRARLPLLQALRFRLPSLPPPQNTLIHSLRFLPCALAFQTAGILSTQLLSILELQTGFRVRRGCNVFERRKKHCIRFL